MKIIEVPIDSILQDTANARSHGEKNMTAIKGSIAKFGQVEPLVVDKKTRVIIGGNGRHAAMNELGYETVKIVELDLTSTEATALALALNRTAELAEWNEDVLGRLLHSLREDNFDLDDIGFDTSYLDNLNNDFNPDIKDKDDDLNIPSEFSIKVIFDNDEERQELFQELNARGLKVKAV